MRCYESVGSRITKIGVTIKGCVLWEIYVI
jgi:hypothetical protein